MSTTTSRSSSAAPLSAGAQRIRHALSSLGAAFEVVELPNSTRTAADAAAAIGCTVAQIAKSIVSTPNAAFRLDPGGLVAITGGTLARVK